MRRYQHQRHVFFLRWLHCAVTTSLSASLDPSCSCASFCNGTCAATNAGKPEQLTMYRLTPGNVTELQGKDTGGSAGDMGFVFQKLRAFSRCSLAQANTVQCFLTLNPVIKQFYVDVDGKYGPFMRCNPLPFPEYQSSHSLVDTRNWGCFPWHGRAPTPWIPSKGDSTSCADGSYCPALMNASVGRDPAMHHEFDPEHPNIAEYFGGEWYSMPPQGMCGDRRVPGDGKSPSCSWRLVPQKVGKTINASCLLDRVLPLVEDNGAACFGKCPQPLDRHSECYYKCVDPSVMGSSAAGGSSVKLQPISRDLMVKAWNAAFASTDASKGGCPDVNVRPSLATMKSDDDDSDGILCTAICDRKGSNHSAVQTSCLQKALDDCHSKSPACSTLLLPAGVYHTGSLAIPSNTTLRLAAGTTLLGSVEPADYPLVGALQGYGMPRDCCCNDWDKYNCSGLGVGVPPQYTFRHRALLTTKAYAANVAIEGVAAGSSIIDGNGWPWWARFETLGLSAGRPHLVEPMFVTNFRIENVSLKDSPFWTLHPYACDGVLIRGLRITADSKRGHNTDGIDPDSCNNVLVENCYVRVGDDAVAIKSGVDFAGRAFARPSQNMIFRT